MKNPHAYFPTHEARLRRAAKSSKQDTVKLEKQDIERRARLEKYKDVIARLGLPVKE
jgi:hypothetical protein